MPVLKLKEALIRDGILKQEELVQYEAEAVRLGQDLSDVLLSRSLVTQIYLNELSAGFYGVPAANLLLRKIDPAVVKLLPEEIAREKRAIVFNKLESGELEVAIQDPNNLQTIEYLSRFLNIKLKIYLASADDLNKGFNFYGAEQAQDFKKIIEENINLSLKTKLADSVSEAALELPIVALVDNLVSYALSSRASDIHIEALEEEVLVRFRVDGILSEIIRIPKLVHPAVIARIKLLAALKLDEHTRPQDGRFRYKIASEAVDIRVAIMPTFYGEKMVLRLLNDSARPLSLEELGFLEDHVKLINESLKKTYGMVLMTGPTGSGKTTTIYSLISILNKPGVNIVTIEDPIEYDMKYVNQTQINPDSGITFASGLREFLRQDPNIIMVGEIRDGDTAKIAAQASLTGHLLLSTVHTNDASTAVPRLIDLGLENFFVANVLSMVEAQRLVRRICPECIATFTPEASMLDILKKQLKLNNLPEIIPKIFYKGTGCAACNKTGYKGRIGIFEILVVDEEVRREIISPNFQLEDLRVILKKHGMVTIFEDGLRKVERGMTTLEEVLRAISI